MSSGFILVVKYQSEACKIEQNVDLSRDSELSRFFYLISLSYSSAKFRLDLQFRRNFTNLNAIFPAISEFLRRAVPFDFRAASPAFAGQDTSSSNRHEDGEECHFQEQDDVTSDGFSRCER